MQHIKHIFSPADNIKDESANTKNIMVSLLGRIFQINGAEINYDGFQIYTLLYILVDDLFSWIYITWTG